MILWDYVSFFHAHIDFLAYFVVFVLLLLIVYII